MRRPQCLRGSTPGEGLSMTRSGLVRGLLALVAASGVLAATAVAADEKDAVGTWKLTYSPGDGEHKATLTVTKGESGLKATFAEGDRKFEVEGVTFKDGELTVSTRTERDGMPATASFKGEVEGDTIKGSAGWTFGGM